MNNSGFGLMAALIVISIGSEITSLTYFYKDETASSQMTIQFIEEDMFGSYSSINSLLTGVATSNPNYQSEIISLNQLVENNKSYRILVLSTAWPSLDLLIKG